MDEERVRLEGIVSALELKVSELDEDNISVEEAARLRAELDDAYERVDESELLDDLQDILEDLVADPDWDDDEEGEEEEEEDDEEPDKKDADNDGDE
jgi:hypothetical protein